MREFCPVCPPPHSPHRIRKWRLAHPCGLLEHFLPDESWQEQVLWLIASGNACQPTVVTGTLGTRHDQDSCMLLGSQASEGLHAGTLAVVRTQPLSPQPYTGTVEITSGEIAEDLAVYMSESEQTNSAVALGVQISPTGDVAAAGGYLIQVCMAHDRRFSVVAHASSWRSSRAASRLCGNACIRHWLPQPAHAAGGGVASGAGWGAPRLGALR